MLKRVGVVIAFDERESPAHLFESRVVDTGDMFCQRLPIRIADDARGLSYMRLPLQRARTIAVGIGELLPLAKELPGGLTMMSAPTPRLRCCESSIKPWLTPTSVRMSITGTPMSRTLSNVRNGRKQMFSQTSFRIN